MQSGYGFGARSVGRSVWRRRGLHCSRSSPTNGKTWRYISKADGRAFHGAELEQMLGGDVSSKFIAVALKVRSRSMSTALLVQVVESSHARRKWRTATRSSTQRSQNPAAWSLQHPHDPFIDPSQKKRTTTDQRAAATPRRADPLEGQILSDYSIPKTPPPNGSATITPDLYSS